MSHFLPVTGATYLAVYLDTAKDIYRNATVEKIALIRFLMAREKTTDQNLRIWEHHLQVTKLLPLMRTQSFLPQSLGNA